MDEKRTSERYITFALDLPTHRDGALEQTPELPASRRCVINEQPFMGNIQPNNVLRSTDLSLLLLSQNPYTIL